MEAISARVVSGTVAGLHRKPEVPGERGLPKPSVPSLQVSARGADGDFNRWRSQERAGDEAMALLLIPMENIEELRREGWPIRLGDLGENVTTRGIPNLQFSPPCRLRVGEATVEISKPCDPCDNLLLLPYVGRSRGAEFLRTMIGRRGWYARVVVPGEIRVGDSIRSLP
ncbi:MAG: MOSC domain-containing protein [Thermoplasmata archaeon]